MSVKSQALRRKAALAELNRQRAAEGNAPVKQLPEDHPLYKAPNAGKPKDHPRGSIIRSVAEAPNQYGVRQIKASKPNSPQYGGPKFGPVGTRRSEFDQGQA